MALTFDLDRGRRSTYSECMCVTPLPKFLSRIDHSLANLLGQLKELSNTIFNVIHTLQTGDSRGPLYNLLRLCLLLTSLLASWRPGVPAHPKDPDPGLTTHMDLANRK